MQHELLTLVRETLAFLIDEHGVDLKKAVPSQPMPIQKMEMKQPSPSKITIEKENELRSHPQKKGEEKKFRNSREVALQEMEHFLSSHMKLLPKAASIFLVELPVDEAHHAFLVSLCDAIQEHITSSVVVKIKNEKELNQLLQSPYLKLLLLPSNEKWHQTEGKILYLAPLAQYQKDIELKRTLWKILKTHSLLVSSSIAK